jgi:hypothetical protein
LRPDPLLAGLLGLGLVLRALVLGWFPGHQMEDLDAYLGIAREILAGNGFCSPGSATPTAYRPPLYPLLLAGVLPLGHWGIPLLHLTLSGVMLVAIWQAGSRLGLSRTGQTLAVLLAATDPLLLWYGSYPMTETLCAALTALALLQLTRWSDEAASGKWQWLAGGVTGILLGLCVLSRPTYWIWLGLLGLLGLWGVIRVCCGRRKQLASEPRDSVNPAATVVNWQVSVVPGLFCVAGLMLTVAPWVMRNALVLGSPVLMTTHGGYTLLLANNPSFYQHEVEQPWGTIWRGAPFDEWSAGLLQELEREQILGEVAIDRWQQAQAREFIRQNPGRFARACLHRLRMFWNVVPGSPSGEPLPGLVRIGLGAGYSLWWLLAVLGCWRVIRRGQLTSSERQASGEDAEALAASWWPTILLILAFAAIHAVYWSNIRLRAPIIPAVALLAGAAAGKRPRPVG